MKEDDFKLFRGFEDRLTDEQTFVNVESLLQLKMMYWYVIVCCLETL